MNLKQLPTAALEALNDAVDSEIVSRQTVGSLASSFVPAFETATIKSALGGEWALNNEYFATRETAEWIAQRYGTGEVVEVPFGGEGGPFVASHRERHIKLANGRTVNAGILAAYYVRAPEARFPGHADAEIREILEREDRMAKGWREE